MNWRGRPQLLEIARFGAKGFQGIVIGYNSMLQVPKPLHVVLHKYIPPVKTAPVKLDPVGSFELNVADLHWTGTSWSKIRLNINADGTATAVTTMVDGKTTIRGTGKWSFKLPNRTDVITLLIQQPDGAPDPEQISGQAIEFDLSGGDDANHRLIQHRGGPAFVRVK